MPSILHVVILLSMYSSYMPITPYVCILEQQSVHKGGGPGRRRRPGPPYGYFVVLNCIFRLHLCDKSFKIQFHSSPYFTKVGHHTSLMLCCKGFQVLLLFGRVRCWKSRQTLTHFLSEKWGQKLCPHFTYAKFPFPVRNWYP